MLNHNCCINRNCCEYIAYVVEPITWIFWGKRLWLHMVAIIRSLKGYLKYWCNLQKSSYTSKLQRISWWNISCLWWLGEEWKPSCICLLLVALQSSSQIWWIKPVIHLCCYYLNYLCIRNLTSAAPYALLLMPSGILFHLCLLKIVVF